MKNKIKFLLPLVVGIILLTGHIVYAEGENVNFSLKNNGVVVFSGNLLLSPDGMQDVNDTDGNPHAVNIRSVLNIVNEADAQSADFDISELTYYASFDAFYLRCITVGGESLCDDWQYEVDGSAPSMGMDQKILSGGESVVLFYGSETPEPAEENLDPIVETPEVVVETPEPIIENPEPSTSSSGSGRRRVKRVATQETEKEKVEAVLPVAEVINPPIEVAIIPAQVSVITVPQQFTEKQEIKKEEVKVVAVNKKEEVNNLAMKNVATVIEATNNTEEKIDLTPKESWVKRFFRWLFWF